MKAKIIPSPLTGVVHAISSKSVAHRAIICAAFSDNPTYIHCSDTCDDINTTCDCLRSLGAKIDSISDGFFVTPISIHDFNNKVITLNCHESASTLRFLLPVVASLNFSASYYGSPHLIERPLDPLLEEMYVAGCTIKYSNKFPLVCSGQLRPGHFQLSGSMSSQYISGLLLAAPILSKLFGIGSSITVYEPVESKPYIKLTIEVLKQFGVTVSVENDTISHTITYTIPPQAYTSPLDITIEGDWSNAAVMLCAGAISNQPIAVNGLNLQSPQGDRAIMAIVSRFGSICKRQLNTVSVRKQKLKAFELDMSDYPDLVPPLACVASVAEGTTVFTHCQRLRYKESNRLESIATTINNLGGIAKVIDNQLQVKGVEQLRGGHVSSYNDHRIVMLASIAASVCSNPVVIDDVEAINKSYPDFFIALSSLGANITFAE